MVVACSLCTHCTSLEVQAEGCGGGGGGGGGGELKKGYTLVFAIPDIHPISGDPVAQLFLLSTF